MGLPDKPHGGPPSPDQNSEANAEYGVSRERMLRLLNILGDESNALLVLAIRKYGPQKSGDFSQLVNDIHNLRETDLEFENLGWGATTLANRYNSVYRDFGILERDQISQLCTLPASPDNELICSTAATLLQNPLLTNDSFEKIFGGHSPSELQGEEYRWRILESIAELDYQASSADEILEIPCQELIQLTGLKEKILKASLKDLSFPELLEYEGTDGRTVKYKALDTKPLNPVDASGIKLSRGLDFYQNILSSVQARKNRFGKQTYKSSEEIARELYPEYDNLNPTQQADRRSKIGIVLNSLGEVEPPYVIKHSGIVKITYENLKKIKEFVNKIHDIQRGNPTAIKNALTFGDWIVSRTPEAAVHARTLVKKSRDAIETYRRRGYLEEPPVEAPIPELEEVQEEVVEEEEEIDLMLDEHIKPEARKIMTALFEIGRNNLDKENFSFSKENFKTIIKRLGGRYIGQTKGSNHGEINLYFADSNYAPSHEGIRVTKLSFIPSHEETFSHIGLREATFKVPSTIEEPEHNPLILLVTQGDLTGKKEKGYRVDIRKQKTKVYRDPNAAAEYLRLDEIIGSFVDANKGGPTLQKITVKS